MKKLLLLAIATAMFSCATTTENTGDDNTLTVSEFLLNPDQFENTTVSVVGQVDHICMGSRAKIHFICPDHPEENIKIFAGEALEEFSDTLMNQVIKITGVVEVSTKIDQAYLDEWEAELAEGSEAEEEEHHHDGEEAEPDYHHHGNQASLIAKYRKQIETSGKGYINLYKIIVTKVEPADQPKKSK